MAISGMNDKVFSSKTVPTGDSDMAIGDDILTFPDDRLTTECSPVAEVTDGIRSLARRMLKSMYATGGVGLAAPQIGELIQLVVIDVDYAEEGGRRNPYVLINPKVVVADGEERTTEEGCLSFPDVAVSVTRPSHVVVEARNLDWDLMRYEATGNLMAVCLQHEIDHLHGITMFDRLRPLQRMRRLREYEEMRRNATARQA